MTGHLRLGVNIDHVATIRNARGGDHPDPWRAVQIVEHAGGDGITIHLREDRRHIRDADLDAVIQRTRLPVNLDMAATEEMLEIASAARCLHSAGTSRRTDNRRRAGRGGPP